MKVICLDTYRRTRQIKVLYESPPAALPAPHWMAERAMFKDEEQQHDNPDGPCCCGAWHKPEDFKKTGA